MTDQHDPFERAVYELLKAARECRRLAPREIHATEYRWLGEVLDTVTDTMRRGSRNAA